MAEVMMGPRGALSIDGLIRVPPKVQSEERLKLISVVADNMQNEIADFGQITKSIRADRNINDAGQVAGLAAAYSALCGRLDSLADSPQAAGYERRGKLLKSQIGSPFAKLRGAPVPVPGSAETRLLLREKLKEENGSIDVEILFREAAESGDPMFLAAVVDVPRGFPIVPPELEAEVEDTYRRTLYPKETGEAAEIEAVLDTLRFNLSAAKNAARTTNGIPVQPNPDAVPIT